MTAEELKELADWVESLDISECGEWRQAKHLHSAARVCRAMAKLERMPGAGKGWLISISRGTTSLFAGMKSGATAIETIENYGK